MWMFNNWETDCHPFPCSRHHMIYGDCLEDKWGHCQNCSFVCFVVYDSCTQWYAHIWAIVKDECCLRFSLCACLGLAFCVFFWFSLDYFVLVLFAFVVFGLLYAKRLAGKKCPKWPILCWVGSKTWTLSRDCQGPVVGCRCRWRAVMRRMLVSWCWRRWLWQNGWWALLTVVCRHPSTRCTTTSLSHRLYKVTACPDAPLMTYTSCVSICMQLSCKIDTFCDHVTSEHGCANV